MLPRKASTEHAKLFGIISDFAIETAPLFNLVFAT